MATFPSNEAPVHAANPFHVHEFLLELAVCDSTVLCHVHEFLLWLFVWYSAVLSHAHGFLLMLVEWKCPSVILKLVKSPLLIEDHVCGIIRLQISDVLRNIKLSKLKFLVELWNCLKITQHNCVRCISDVCFGCIHVFWYSDHSFLDYQSLCRV